jgi:hypothetical protein
LTDRDFVAGLDLWDEPHDSPFMIMGSDCPFLLDLLLFQPSRWRTGFWLTFATAEVCQRGVNKLVY